MSTPMIDDAELHRRLIEWAQAYAGEQYQRLGHGAVDRITTPAAPAASGAAGGAHEIQNVVACMEQHGRHKEARVLRCEYFLGALSEDERIALLRQRGFGISRAAYYTYLRSARLAIQLALAHHNSQLAKAS